jgi:hypothetical protein
MGTYLALQQKIAEAIQDPDNDTFTVSTVKSMIDSIQADLSRIAPKRFTEDITPVADTLSYQVLVDDFPDPNDDIEIMSVEVWDGSATPPRPWRLIEAQSSHPMSLNYSQAGWRFWDGFLYLPNRIVDFIDPDIHVIRVWGYSPWPDMVEDEDTVPFGRQHEEALLRGVYVETMRRLIGNRVLFAQWATRSNNTDITPAYLMNEKAQAQDEWAKLLRGIMVQREAP